LKPFWTSEEDDMRASGRKQLIPWTQHKAFRYVTLLSISLATFGSYFSYDLPASISPDLVAATGITENEYTHLYTVYNVSNTVSVLFVGWIINQIGTRFSGLLFTALICLGQSLFAFGVQVSSYPLMLVGRIVFGLGSGCIVVVQDTVTALYFKGKELSLAFCITMTVCRLGTVLNYFISPALADAIGVSNTVWLSCGLCYLSIAFVVSFYLLDLQNDKANGVSLRAPCTEARAQRRQHRQLTRGLHNQERSESSDAPSSRAAEDHSPTCSERFAAFKASVTLRPEFWMLTIVCAVFYGCLYPFLSVAVLMFEDGWSFSQSAASIASGIVYDISLALGLLFGILVDKRGNRINFLWMAIALLFFANVFLMATYQPDGGSAVVPWVPYLCMVFAGIAYMFVAGSLWSAVGIVVRKAQTGVALSLLTTIQMGFVSIVQAIVGPLMEAAGTFSADLGLFLGMSAGNLVVVIVLVCFDKRNYNILNKADTTGIYKEDVESPEGCLIERVGEALRTGSMSLHGSRANSIVGYAKGGAPELPAGSRRSSLQRASEASRRGSAVSGVATDTTAVTAVAATTLLRAQDRPADESESLLQSEGP